MKKQIYILLLICAVHGWAGPHIARKNNISQLIVNKNPFIVLSIEDHKIVGNGVQPDEFYFQKAKELYANTVSYTFRWDLFEKIKDDYDTTLLRTVKQTAEKYGLKIILIWFGSNVSGHENCVPDYIRRDPQTYIPYTRSDRSLAKKENGADNGIYCYSFDKDHSNPLLTREQKALQNLLGWIRKYDREETFIMLQLENELFVNPDLWFSLRLADRSFTERCHCWRCNEIFKIWAPGSDREFVQSVFLYYIKGLATAAGKTAPGFPLFLNLVVSWGGKSLLGNPNNQAKKYLDSIPALSFIAPDIYFENMVAALDSMAFGRNVIFIPEAGKPRNPDFPGGLDIHSIPFLLLGKYHGIGVQIYDLKSDDFGLLSAAGEWTDDAYRVRNSFALLSQIPARYYPYAIGGFRKQDIAYFLTGNYNITITPTDDSKHARGVILRNKKELIIGGIGFKTEIRSPNLPKIKTDRGYWENLKFKSLGGLKPASYTRDSDRITLTFDDDDYGATGIFDVKARQYCVRLSY